MRGTAEETLLDVQAELAAAADAEARDARGRRSKKIRRGRTDEADDAAEREAEREAERSDCSASRSDSEDSDSDGERSDGEYEKAEEVSAAELEGRVAAAQGLSGTGGLRVCAQLIERLPRLTGSSQKPVCYMPEPTWGNHAKVFQDAGVEVRRYRYLDSNTKTTLDYDGMKEDLMKAEKGSTILLHACAHNPTGVDPSPDQWRDLSSALKKTDLQLFFD